MPTGPRPGGLWSSFGWPIRPRRRNLLVKQRLLTNLPTKATSNGDRFIFKTPFANIAHLTAPFRRPGAPSFARILVIIIGLAAMTAYTVPELQRSAGGWLVACLWS